MTEPVLFHHQRHKGKQNFNYDKLLKGKMKKKLHFAYYSHILLSNLTL